MDAPSSNLADAETEIGGYQVIRVLSPDRSWLARAPGGRLIVLKALDDDCLWKGQLHPNIKDRLGRVRELAHVGVANLFGVERAGSLVYMVWEYVPGVTLDDEHVAARERPGRDVLALMRELILSVEMLHARGIVHGAIRASNVIVGERGERATLTHVSPLLYGDPQEDVRAVTAMLRELLGRRGEGGSAAAKLLEEVPARDLSLRQLAGRLGGMIESREGELADGTGMRDSGGIRRRTLMAAAGVAALAVALFTGIRIYAHQRSPKAPVPPDAGPVLLQPAPDAGKTTPVP
jgi:hypothetical protein